MFFTGVSRHLIWGSLCALFIWFGMLFVTPNASAFGGNAATSGHTSGSLACGTIANDLVACDARSTKVIGNCGSYTKYDVRDLNTNYGRTETFLKNISTSATQYMGARFNWGGSSNVDVVTLSVYAPTASEIETLCSGATGSADEIEVLDVSYSIKDKDGNDVNGSTAKPYRVTVFTITSVKYRNVSSDTIYVWSTTMETQDGTEGGTVLVTGNQVGEADTTAPSGHSVAFDQSSANSGNVLRTAVQN